MEKIKKISILFVSMLVIFCISIMATGCDDEQSKEEEEVGTFYSLQEAYENKLLTSEDLQSIANYHNNGKVYPEDLDDTVAQLIKNLAACHSRNDKHSPILEAKAEDYEILKYYGAYNGCYAVILNHPYTDVLAVEIDEWVTIGSVMIHYTSHNNIIIWKNDIQESPEPVESGKFYTLQEAYDNGLLTKENLQSIQQYHSSGFQNRPSPDDLNEDIAETIKRDWVKQYKEENNVTKEITAYIRQYYGTYSGCIAVIMDRTDAMYIAVDAPIIIEVGGVTFTYGNIYLPKIVIWCQELPFVPNNCEVVVESTLYSHIENCKDFIALCKNLEELKQECLRNGYDFFDENNQGNNYYNTYVGQKIREYTDAYFEEKVFLVCAYYKDSWIGQYRIEEVKINAGKLSLYIKSPKNYSADEVINNVFIIAGVDKSLVSGVTDLEYILR